MEVHGYDPYISVDSAWGLSRAVKHSLTLDDIYESCDYITVHVPQTPDTKNMINKDSIAKMKDGVRILNFARGGLVNSADMVAAVEAGKVSVYVTDFRPTTCLAWMGDRYPPLGRFHSGIRGQLRPDGRR